MGKRKIGEIYNKPIIEGDINLKTPNEIHKSELSGELGGGSGVEDAYVYMKLVNPYSDMTDNEFVSNAGQQFFCTTIIGVPINDIMEHPAAMMYLTGLFNTIKSLAGSKYVKESGDGDAGLGGKLSPWDLISTINLEWNGGASNQIRAIQFYKNTNSIGYSYANSGPNPNYNNMAANDILLRKIAEYFKTKLPEYFTEYETINIYMSVNLMFAGMMTNINMTDYDGLISYLDKLIEECKNEYSDLYWFLKAYSKKTFVEITKEEYDNICIDVMKNETAGYSKKTLYEMYVAYNNNVEEMFK